jgi:Tfp pilus assembly protein PilF
LRRINWIQLGAGLLAAAALAHPAAASVESELAFHRGIVAFGEERLDAAWDEFQKVLAEDPEDTAALHYLALIAQKRKDPTAAIALYDRALALDPQDASLHMDRGIALLDAGQLPEARASLARALELDPAQPRAELFAGIAAHRAGAYAEAKPHFDRAAELDPTLRDEARYYTGLGEALSGNLQAASTAFADAQEAGPLSPLGQSAQNLRRKLAPAEERRWQASMTAGMEWDDNPTIIGTLLGIQGFADEDADSDFRGVLRPSGSYRFYDGDRVSAIGGYDGYLSFHIEEKEVDLQIHNPWAAVSYGVGRLRLGLRGDYAYTMADLTDSFRHLGRATPTASWRLADWALIQGFYQFTGNDFLVDETEGTFADRDGFQHVFGLNQFFFLPEPYTFVRIGAYGDFNETDGTEFQYDGMEANFGAGYDFIWDVSFTWLYRFAYRDYDDPSNFAVPSLAQTREDFRHVFTVELEKGLGEHWAVSVGGAFTWNISNVNFYDYSRNIVGSYVTYSF